GGEGGHVIVWEWHKAAGPDRTFWRSWRRVEVTRQSRRLDFAASYLQRKQSGGSGEDWEAGIINAAGRGAPTVSRREI
ncbi:unnamed protein product, partial [Ascophyllum nodosum]